jgi:hypothetical protein
MASAAFAADCQQPDLRRPGDAPKESFGTVSFDIENDISAGTDQHYSNGLRATYLSPEKACLDGIAGFLTDTIPILPRNAVRRTGFTIGNNIYTPQNIVTSQLQPKDRPYAGWTYAGLIVTAEQREGDKYPTELEVLEVDIGMVGPVSGSEWIQKNWHEAFGFQRPNGWEHQLKNEPGIIVSYERKWRWGTPVRDGFGVDAMPSLAASLGNIHTHASAGLLARIGWNLPDDFGPSSIRPSLPGSAFFRQDNVGFYLFGGVEGRAVARNIFLDGNTFQDSQNVNKIPLVGDVKLGVAVSFPRFRVSYTQTLRSPEFEHQQGGDSYGALSVAFNW